jgi:hypothetical protein
MLIAEGKRLVKEQEVSGWRLAEIVHDLREEGMTYLAIADELGWKGERSARSHDKALSYRDTKSFADALVLTGMSHDRAAAVEAVAESEGIAIGTAKSRTPEIKAIAAEIADLPQEQKEQIARELATGDREFTSAINKAQFEETTERRERTAKKRAADHVGRGLDGQIALKTLQVESNKFIQKARGLFPEIGVIPDGERFWLNGQADSLEDVVAELRHMADTGTTRTESELQRIAEVG